MSTLTNKRMALLPGDTGKFAGILSGSFCCWRCCRS